MKKFIIILIYCFFIMSCNLLENRGNLSDAMDQAKLPPNEQTLKF